MMTTTIKASYEHGVLKPVKPLDLKDGTEVEIVVISQKQSPADGSDSIAGSPDDKKTTVSKYKGKTPSQIIAAIADLSNEEGPDDGFSGSDHDKSSLRPGEVTALDLVDTSGWLRSCQI